MKLNIKEFMETEMGYELDETIHAWNAASEQMDKAKSAGNEKDYEEWNNTCMCCQECWSVIKTAMKQFYNVDLKFVYTDEYFGVCTKDESLWLIKEAR